MLLLGFIWSPGLSENISWSCKCLSNTQSNLWAESEVWSSWTRPKKNILSRKCKGVFDYLGHRSSSVSGWIACFITFSKLHVATLPPMPARWCTLMQSLHTSCQFSLGLDQSRAEEFHPASEKAKPRIVSGSILAQCLPFLGLCNASWARRQELVVRDIGALTKTFAPHFPKKGFSRHFSFYFLVKQ